MALGVACWRRLRGERSGGRLGGLGGGRLAALASKGRSLAGFSCEEFAMTFVGKGRKYRIHVIAVRVVRMLIPVQPVPSSVKPSRMLRLEL